MSQVDRKVEISGPRLTLARFATNDFDAVHAFASDPLVCEFTTWGPNTDEETRLFIAEALQPAPDRYVLAVMLGKEVIGSAAAWVTSSNDRVGELGYTIRRDCWNRGFGTEVATLLMHIGFEYLRLDRMVATCAPDNIGSIRVLEKVGLRREGLLRGNYLVRGNRRDSVIFGRLVTDI